MSKTTQKGSKKTGNYAKSCIIMHKYLLLYKTNENKGKYGTIFKRNKVNRERKF